MKLKNALTPSSDGEFYRIAKKISLYKFGYKCKVLNF